MKQLWICILCMLLLCGCSLAFPEFPTEATEPSIAETLPPPTEEIPQPPQALVEITPQSSCNGICSLGEYYLISQKDQWVLCEKDSWEPVSTLDKKGLPSVFSGEVQVRENGVAYYDAADNAVCFLDEMLQLRGSFSMPEHMVGKVCISADWSVVYYCTEDAVQVLDLSTGISRVLTETVGNVTLEELVLGGKGFRCTVKLENAVKKTVYISTKTGGYLFDPNEPVRFHSAGDRFFAERDSQPLQEWIFGSTEEGKLWNLWPTERYARFDAALEHGGVVLRTKTDEGTELSFFDLTKGTLMDKVVIPKAIKWIRADDEAIWIRTATRLYRWQPIYGQQEETALYIQKRQTYDDPDDAGLDKIRQELESWKESYGVEILLWKDAEAALPEGYTAELEFMTQRYETALAELKQLLEPLPEDLLTGLAKWTDSGTVKILLVRQLQGESAELAATGGIQYFRDGEMYMVLQIDKPMTSTFYHQLAHVMETPLLSGSTACYEWHQWNPAGFSYDNDYEKNALRQDTQYLEGEKRAFVDLFSMSFAREDRCRIFEYAIQPGNEAIFQSATMQKKLQRICKGIREAFGLTEEVYLWEQYLK